MCVGDPTHYGTTATPPSLSLYFCSSSSMSPWTGPLGHTHHGATPRPHTPRRGPSATHHGATPRPHTPRRDPSATHTTARPLPWPNPAYLKHRCAGGDSDAAAATSSPRLGPRASSSADRRRRHHTTRVRHAMARHCRTPCPALPPPPPPWELIQRCVPRPAPHLIQRCVPRPAPHLIQRCVPRPAPHLIQRCVSRPAPHLIQRCVSRPAPHLIQRCMPRPAPPQQRGRPLPLVPSKPHSHTQPCDGPAGGPATIQHRSMPWSSIQIPCGWPAVRPTALHAPTQVGRQAASMPGSIHAIPRHAILLQDSAPRLHARRALRDSGRQAASALCCLADWCPFYSRKQISTASRVADCIDPAGRVGGGVRGNDSPFHDPHPSVLRRANHATPSYNYSALQRPLWRRPAPPTLRRASVAEGRRRPPSDLEGGPLG
jgi:hypothetical protein